MKTYHLQISGKVQGVWYRASAKDKAISLKVKGKVWNEPDGTVGAYVQGPEEDINTFITWCREGPDMAKVDEVLVREFDSEEIYHDFRISKGG